MSTVRNRSEASAFFVQQDVSSLLDSKGLMLPVHRHCILDAFLPAFAAKVLPSGRCLIAVVHLAGSLNMSLFWRLRHTKMVLFQLAFWHHGGVQLVTVCYHGQHFRTCITSMRIARMLVDAFQDT